MFIEFSLGNFRSYKDITTFSLVAANLKPNKYNPSLDTENVINFSEKLHLVKSKAIVGANASGKSNLYKAFFIFLTLIQRSVNDENALESLITNFALSTETEVLPSFFQLIFYHKNTNTIYRYGFEATKNEIITEWLFGRINAPKHPEVAYFTREGRSIDVNKERFKEAAQFAQQMVGADNELFRNNALFLTITSTLGVKFSKNITFHLSETISMVSGIDSHLRTSIRKTLVKKFEDSETKIKILSLLKSADLGIENMEIAEKSQDSNNVPKELQELFKQGTLKLETPFDSFKSKYNENHEKITEILKLNFDDVESEGTKKFFYLSPILISTLEKGGILIVDELDARLHPALIKILVSLFNSSKTNPYNAQFIFITHDASILNANLLRKDQVCFIEKNKYGESFIKELAQYKKLVNDFYYVHDYEAGRFGAKGYLNEITNFFSTLNTTKNNEPKTS